MPTRNEFLPFFQRLLLVLRKALARLLARRPVSEAIQVQASVIQLVDLHARGDLDFEGLLDRLVTIVALDGEEERVLLEEILGELEIQHLDAEASVLKERLISDRS